jgi:hypothetical protein
MTHEEYGDSLLREAKEINFQYEILVNDITWIEEKIRALYEKVLADPFTMREKHIEDLEFLMTKFRINLEAREKMKAKSLELGAKVNEFFGKDLWKPL